METTAKIFASQIALPNNEFLELAERGFDTQHIASAMNTDINLVALKAEINISKKHKLRQKNDENF